MANLPAGYRLIEKELTGSTNADCLEAAIAGEPGGLWLRARTQTAGRGSRGRNWVSDPGNLFASLLLDMPADAKDLSTLTFVTSLAVADSVDVLGSELAARHIDRPGVSLKWPNDVLLDGRKLAGILLESHRIGDRSVIIVGIGVNCVSHPSESNYPATSLRSAGYELDAGQVLEVLAVQFHQRLAQWDWGRGFASIRVDWLARAAGVGEEIETRIGGETRRGVFETIDETGLLILRAASGGRQGISVADIFLQGSREAVVG